MRQGPTARYILAVSDSMLMRESGGEGGSVTSYVWLALGSGNSCELAPRMAAALRDRVCHVEDSVLIQTHKRQCETVPSSCFKRRGMDLGIGVMRSPEVARANG